MLKAFVAGGERDDPIGHRAVRDEMLGAVEHESVVVAPVSRSHPGDVGAGGRFGNRKGAEREFFGQRTEIGPLLGLIACDNYRQRAEVVGGNRVGDAGTSVIELFANQTGIEDAKAGTAEFARHAEVHQAGGKGLFANITRKDFLVVVLASARNDLVLAEFAGEGFELALLVGQIESKHRNLFPGGLRSRYCRLATISRAVNLIAWRGMERAC